MTLFCQGGIKLVSTTGFPGRKEYIDGWKLEKYLWSKFNMILKWKLRKTDTLRMIFRFYFLLFFFFKKKHLIITHIYNKVPTVRRTMAQSGVI